MVISWLNLWTTNQKTTALITQSFSKKNRLLTSKDFSVVFDRAQYRIGCSEFLLLAIENNLSVCRLGLVVGKKNTRLAVNRNKIKRAFRESFRKFAISMFNDDGLDIVIVTRPGVSKCARKDLPGQITRIWEKLHRKVIKGKANDS